LREDDKTDLELVALARAGLAHDAVATLVRRHTPQVRAIVYPMLLNHADADDVTQDAMVKVVSSLGTFKGNAAFSTWVHRVAVNTALNFIKRQKRHRAMEAEGVDTLTQLEDTTAARPSDGLEAEEADAAVSRAMSKLSPEQRLAVSLVIMQGMDERTAAAVAECHAATLRWRLHAARKKLKTLLMDMRSAR